ncbi:MAG TPA: YcxB family protein [Allosphingosinicella sp.]|nr:YcxB family protein [Allosphingosinicella sp.]
MRGETSYTATAAQSIDASYDLMLYRLRRPRAALIFGGAILFVGLSGAWASWKGGDGPQGIAGTFLVGLGLGAIFLSLFFGACLLLIPWRVRRLFRQMRTRGGPTCWSWDEEGIGASSANGNVRFAWSELYRVHRGRRTFLLFINDQRNMILPREALDAAQEQSLMQALSAHEVPGA